MPAAPKPSYVTVAFSDGHEETVKLGGAALVQIERRWKGLRIPPVESAYFGAWYALGRPGVGSDDESKFDDWLSGCDGIESAEGEDAVPTLPAP